MKGWYVSESVLQEKDARIAALEAALKPFAELLERLPNFHDGWPGTKAVTTSISMARLREARRLLATKAEETGT